jgi:rubrerythrin
VSHRVGCQDFVILQKSIREGFGLHDGGMSSQDVLRNHLGEIIMLSKLTPEKISQWEQKRLVKKLIKARSDKNKSLAKIAEEALGRILKSCYDDLGTLADRKAKIKALEIIGRIKDPASADKLRSAWYSCIGPERVAIVKVLGELRDAKAADKIRSDLNNATWGADRSAKLRRAAKKALRKIGTSEASNILNQHQSMKFSEAKARQKGTTFKCPYCGYKVSMHTTACPKCRGIMKK